MAHSPASTNPTFFEKYNFDFDPHVSLYAEFLRLAESRQWKQGSKSKAFEQAWYTCSGSDVPVGCNVDREAGQVGAQRTTDDEVFSSILLGLENLELATRATKKGMKCKDVGREFAMHYGADASLKERWQALCRDCGVNPPPSSITKCKKALKGLNINIFHFLQAKRAARLPYCFRSRGDLVVFMEKHPRMRYPLDLAKGNRFLSVLLIECW